MDFPASHVWLPKGYQNVGPNESPLQWSRYDVCLQVVRLRPEWLCGCDGVHARSHWFWIPWWSVQGRKTWESSLLKPTGVDRCIIKPLRLSYSIYIYIHICGLWCQPIYLFIHVSIYPSIYNLCQFIRLSIHSPRIQFGTQRQPCKTIIGLSSKGHVSPFHLSLYLSLLDFHT